MDAAGQPHTPSTPVLLDVDTGVDDALAILFAVSHPALDVRAITCVAGNTDVDQAVVNSLRVLDQLGASDIPVARGADRPLLNPPYAIPHIHGTDGLADLGLPSPTRAPVAVHAVELMRQQLDAAPAPLTLIPLGPMTNIALLLRMYPHVVERIDRIVFMGGAIGRGNATAVAEFNVWHDPEAAAVVLDADVDLTMYGLDVFHAVAVEGPTIAELRRSSSPASRLAGDLLAYFHERNRNDPSLPPGGLLGDAGATCVVADPSRLETEDRPVRVEVAPGLCRGQTVVDLRDERGEREVPEAAGRRIAVAVGIDPDHYRDLFVSTLVRG